MSVYVPDRVWVDYGRIRDAENAFHTGQTSSPSAPSSSSVNDLLQIIETLQRNQQESMRVISELTQRVSALEIKCSTCVPAPAVCPAKPAPKKAPAPADDDDDDLDLFGDDDGAAPAKKAAPVPVAKPKKKGEVIAKSSVVLEIKPWDDETDMKKMEECVRSIEQDGLLWGTSKLVPVAYNVKKLQIVCVVEDEKVSIEELQEKIELFEDYVQSVDVAAFNKI